jgi:N-methylhydantoinase B
MGGRPGKIGIYAVHTHMTNSLNTPAEALEYAYPLRVTRYAIRRGSGGAGRFSGGDGVVREIEMLSAEPSTVTLLADRRTHGPYGLNGGAEGRPGKATVMRTNGREEPLAGKASTRLKRGDRIRVESPGAGGWGKP